MSSGLPPSLARLFALPEEKRHIGVFRVSRQLGKGGFAPVWLATEVYGGTELRTVALKLFALDGPPETGAGTAVGTITDAKSREARKEQIVAEARALCQVEHPNIVRFFTLAVDETGDILGLAMEYVRGTPLDQKIARAGKLELKETLAVGSALASALAAVHQVGLVHRDIKPANVIDAAGVYKLIDFGIAKVGRRNERRGRKTRANGRALERRRGAGEEARAAPAARSPAARHCRHHPRRRRALAPDETGEGGHRSGDAQSDRDAQRPDAPADQAERQAPAEGGSRAAATGSRGPSATWTR